jgi:2-dehydropantoate 2-reductase
MRGVCLPAGHVEAPGVIHMDAPGDTWLGPFEPKPASMDEVRALAKAITRGGMNTLALEDARPAQWTKLLFNSATNPLAALTGLTHGQICSLPPVRKLIGRLVAEGRAVADALGIALENDPEAVIDQAARDNFDHKPSMLQDVLARRRTEIHALNGGIVRAGSEAGAPTPLHEAITALIEGLEKSWETR